MNLPGAALSSFSIARDMKLPWLKLFIGVMMQGPETMIKLAHMATAFKKYRWPPKVATSKKAFT